MALPSAPSAPPTPTSPFPSPNTSQPSSLSRLTLSDKLLLAQAVHHIGSSPPDWGRVSSVLLSHPLIRTKSRLEQASKAGITLGRIFGSRECERAWVALMRQYNLVLQPGEKEIINESEGEGSSTLANRAKEARGLPPKTDRGSQLALAQSLYAERILEIQESIKLKEQRFKALVADIEALNSGALDAKLSVEVNALNAQADTPAVEASSRPPPKDRTSIAGQAPTTPGSRTTRLSRSGSSATAPALGTTEGAASNEDENAEEEANQNAPVSEGDDAQLGDEMEVDVVTPMQEDVDAKVEESAKKEAQMIDENEREESVAAEEGKGAPDDAVAEIIDEGEEEEEADDVTSKPTRSSKRKRDGEPDPSIAEKKKQTQKERRGSAIEEEKNSVAEEEREREDIEDNDEEDQQKQLQPRRSRRSGRGAAQEDDSQTTITPASAVTSSTKNRLGALRSPETSGASQDGEEEIESGDMDTSRSTAERGASRTSISPASTRRGRGTRRLSSIVATSRHSRGGSNTSRHDGELSEVEREKAEKEKAKRKNEKVLVMLLNEVSNHTHGNLFHSAIKRQDAPDYYILIRHPLDLKTIKTRIKEGIITNSVQLRRALNQMFANSLIYNRPGTEIHRMALEMRDAAEEVSRRKGKSLTIHLISHLVSLQMIDRFEQTQLSASYARR